MFIHSGSYHRILPAESSEQLWVQLQSNFFFARPVKSWLVLSPGSVTRIYSNIQIFEYFWSKYLFGYSFVSFLGYEYIRIFVRVNFLDTNIFGYSFVARFWFEYIRIFVRINFQDTNRFRRCFYWFSLDIILCLWIFCWYQWSKMLFRL